MILTPPTPQALIADTIRLIPMDVDSIMDSIMAATIEANYTYFDLLIVGTLIVVGILAIREWVYGYEPRKKGKKNGRA